MAIQETILLGETVLRETASLIDTSANSIDTVITDLIDTMRANELAAMAAPQINVSLALFVSEIRETKYRSGETDELRIYINPEITQVSPETELGWEGCGSIPGIFAQVKRHSSLTVRFLDQTLVSREMHASGLLARIIQHEVDHLHGKMFTDIADPHTFVSSQYYLEHIRGR